MFEKMHLVHYRSSAPYCSQSDPNLKDFMQLLTAVLLERSLIFVSNNYTFLSNTVLGFKTVIKPFQWCYSLVPVLPSILVDYLDTPQPILAGLSDKDFKESNLTDEELD